MFQHYKYIYATNGDENEEIHSNPESYILIESYSLEHLSLLSSCPLGDASNPGVILGGCGSEHVTSIVESYMMFLSC